MLGELMKTFKKSATESTFISYKLSKNTVVDGKNNPIDENENFNIAKKEIVVLSEEVQNSVFLHNKRT